MKIKTRILRKKGFVFLIRSPAPRLDVDQGKSLVSRANLVRHGGLMVFICRRLPANEKNNFSVLSACLAIASTPEAGQRRRVTRAKRVVKITSSTTRQT